MDNYLNKCRKFNFMKSNHISQSIQSLSKQLSKLVVLGEIVGEFDGREVGIFKGRVVGSDVGV